MKILTPNFFFSTFGLLIALASCHKDNMTPVTGATTAMGGQPTTTSGGQTAAAPGSIYVLSSGKLNAYTLDSATLANVPHYTPGSLLNYNFASKKLIADQYSFANGTPMSGGTGFNIYGSKMYIVSSGMLTVANAKTSKLIKQVKIGNLYNSNYSTWGIAFYKSNFFLSGGRGTVTVYDTATLAVTKNIQVVEDGGLAVANGKLYVADTDFQNSMVSIIDLTTLTLSNTTVFVKPEPVTMAADDNGNVYTLSPFDDDAGNIYGYNGGLSEINSKTNNVSVCQTYVPSPNNLTLAAQGTFAYFFDGLKQLIAFNSTTHTSAAFVTDGTLFINPRCIAANPATGEVYVGDAKDKISNGTLYAFDKTGKLEYTLTTGICPAQIVLAN